MAGPWVLSKLMRHPWAFMSVRFYSRVTAACSLFEPVSQHGFIDTVEPSHSRREKGLFHIALVQTAREFEYPHGCSVILSWNLRPGESKVVLMFWYQRDWERGFSSGQEGMSVVIGFCTWVSPSHSVWNSQSTGATTEFSWWESTVGFQLLLIFFAGHAGRIYRNTASLNVLAAFKSLVKVVIFSPGILYCFYSVTWVGTASLGGLWCTFPTSPSYEQIFQIEEIPTGFNERSQYRYVRRQWQVCIQQWEQHWSSTLGLRRFHLGGYSNFCFFYSIFKFNQLNVWPLPFKRSWQGSRLNISIQKSHKSLYAPPSLSSCGLPGDAETLAPSPVPLLFKGWQVGVGGHRVREQRYWRVPLGFMVPPGVGDGFPWRNLVPSRHFQFQPDCPGFSRLLALGLP